MVRNIPEIIKSLKINYIIHIILFSLIFVFNLVIISQIYWLKDIYKLIYLTADLISLINYILPILVLIFIGIKKLTRKNIKVIKNLTVFFCITIIFFGLFFASILMINAIESPEFCKECPFNLDLNDINNIINSNNINKKCKERRCVINWPNTNILTKNENNYYEYICNYDPSSEFEEIQENYDNININDINNTNINDKIICNKIIEDEHLISTGLENTYSLNFYDKCNLFTDLYICERTKSPNKYFLKENFICPNKDYLTKLIILCMINIFMNLVLNFIPWKAEYNKFINIINLLHPRNIIIKANSFNSTFNSSKIQKDEEDNNKEDKFEKSPTEILIVYNNNNSEVNNINTETKNDNNINNNNADGDNILVIKKSKSKKTLNFKDITERNNENICDKNKTEIKISNNVINSINNNNNIKDNNNKISIPFDDNNNITSTNKIIPDKKKKS